MRGPILKPGGSGGPGASCGRRDPGRARPSVDGARGNGGLPWGECSGARRGKPVGGGRRGGVVGGAGRDGVEWGGGVGRRSGPERLVEVGG